MASKDFFTKIGNSISSAGKDGMTKAKELKDTAKINVDIRERENAIHKMYRELGKAYYHDHRDDASSEYHDKISAIKAAFEEIGELKSAKDDVRGIKRCPDCGHVIAPGAKYCAGCGRRCDDVAADYEIVDDDAEEPASEEPADEASASEEPVNQEPADGAAASEEPAADEAAAKQ